MSILQENPDLLPRLPDFLERRDDSEVHLAGHRVTLENICFYYNEGYSAEMLRERFPTLPLVLIHKVIVFYLENREAVDRYLATCQRVRDSHFDQWQEAGPAAPDLVELRRRREAREREPRTVEVTVRFLLDENQRGPLWEAIQRHNEAGGQGIDAMRVGEGDGPSLGSEDPELLVWCEAAERILVSEDGSTLPVHLAAHLAAGRHSPCVFLIRPGQSIRLVVEFLALATAVSEPSEWRDRIAYVLSAAGGPP